MAHSECMHHWRQWPWLHGHAERVYLRHGAVAFRVRGIQLCVDEAMYTDEPVHAHTSVRPPGEFMWPLGCDMQNLGE